MQKSRACALSIDISGPHRAEGTEDHEVTKPKYLLVETPEEAPIERALTATESKQIEEDNKRWENIIATCKDTNYKLIEILMVEVLPSTSTHAVIGALNRFYSRLRFWGLPTYRLHSGCAGEFTHHNLRRWAAHRGIHVATTMPESKASNGRAECLVARLKVQIRALLSANSLEPGMWPHAARYLNDPRVC